MVLFILWEISSDVMGVIGDLGVFMLKELKFLKCLYDLFKNFFRFDNNCLFKVMIVFKFLGVKVKLIIGVVLLWNV